MADGIALFGGSFNPIHNGHMIIARAVAEHLELSRVILIPSANPPHKHGHDDLAGAADRLEMSRLAAEGEAGLEVSDIEVQRSGPSYTFDTVQAYRKKFGEDAQLYWIIGGDTLPEMHTWYRVNELVDLCRMVTAVRPGFDAPDLSALATTLSPGQVQRLRDSILPTPNIDISATDIRQRIGQGRSIRYLVPEVVREYINSKQIYLCGKMSK